MAAPFTTYDVGSTGGNREDLLDFITNIDPVETPMFSNFGRGTAQGTLHEWLNDTLAAASSNAVIEGSSAAYGDLTNRTRSGNYTQIMRKTFDVSDTQDAVNKAGIPGREFDYQAMKAAKELARDVEWNIINSTSASGSESVARKMRGVDASVTTNVTAAGSSALSGLEDSHFNKVLQLCWVAGGRPGSVYCNAFNKRQISLFTAGTTKFTAVKDAPLKTLIRGVDVYDSDFGRLVVYPDRHVDADTVYILEDARFKVSYLRPTKKEELARIGSSHRGMIEAELTLEILAETSSGVITGTSTS